MKRSHRYKSPRHRRFAICSYESSAAEHERKLGLPDDTGFQLMEDLRDIPSLQGIALSGYGMDEDLRRAREAGFAAHLIKPVDFQQLRQAVWNLVDEPSQFAGKRTSESS